MTKSDINLLPPQRREMIQRSARMVSWGRFVDGLAISLMLMTCTGVVLLAALWVTFLSARDDQTGELKKVVGEYRELREAVANQNQVLEQAARLGSGRMLWAELVQTVLSNTAPAQVREVRASVQTESELVQRATLTLIGTAPSRSSLAAVAQRLEALEEVADVQSPTSNLLNRENPSFELIINIKLPDV